MNSNRARKQYLFWDVFQRIRLVNGEADQQHVCVWVGERAETIVVFLAWKVEWRGTATASTHANSSTSTPEPTRKHVPWAALFCKTCGCTRARENIEGLYSPRHGIHAQRRAAWALCGPVPVSGTPRSVVKTKHQRAHAPILPAVSHSASSTLTPSTVMSAT